MTKYTTIQVSKKTLELLKSHKFHPRESYVEVVDRLIKEYKQQRGY